MIIRRFSPETFYLRCMKLKSVFGAVLTVLGIAGLIYAAVLFAGDTASNKSLLVYGVLGFIFFISGIGLIRNL